MLFDEMNGTGSADNGAKRQPYARMSQWLATLKPDEARKALDDAEAIFRKQGITFAVYGSGEASERLIPFDFVPRIFAAQEWRRLSLGIEQRVRALNMFLHDI